MTLPQTLPSDLADAVEAAELQGPPPSWQIAQRAGRIRARRHRRVIAAGFCMLATLVGGIGVASNVSRTPVASAGEVPDNTYVLTRFEVTYPYRAGPGAPADPSNAAVSFHAAWSGDTLPGLAACQLLVMDRDGTVIGELAFHGEYVTPYANPPALSVPVSGKPATASGYCARGSGASGPGYRFDVLDIVASRPPETGSTIHAVARWAQSEEPGWRSCDLILQLNDGTTTHQPMGIDVPDGAAFALRTPNDPGEISDARVECQDPTA